MAIAFRETLLPFILRSIAISTIIVVALFIVVSVSSVRAQQQFVELELVLAIDTSASVDPEEFELQWRGLSQAFLHGDVVKAIQGAGKRGIAVTVIQWSGKRIHRQVVDWTLLHDAQSAARFAYSIQGASRRLTGYTDIASAIRFSHQLLESNTYFGERQVIDVSGDGSSTGTNPSEQRDLTVAQGITINGLVIFDKNPDLYELGLHAYYSEHVVGGNGAFLITAADFEDFAIAIRKKLVREIMGPKLAQRGPVEPRKQQIVPAHTAATITETVLAALRLFPSRLGETILRR